MQIVHSLMEYLEDKDILSNTCEIVLKMSGKLICRISPTYFRDAYI